MQASFYRPKLLLLLFLSLPSFMVAQINLLKNDGGRKVFLGVSPMALKAPETGWAGGAGVQLGWKFKRTYTGLLSYVTPTFIYSQKDQLAASLPFRLYWGKKAWTSFGEFSYFDYNFNFYGIGNEANPDHLEEYSYESKRIRLNLLRAVRGSTFMGLSYSYDDVEITQTDPNGMLTDGEIVGSRGGVTSGAGWKTILETRNSVFYPNRGEYIESELFYSGPFLGSDFEYFRYTLDGRKYIPIRYGRHRYYYRDDVRWRVNLLHVLAIQFFTQSNWGDPSFDQLARLGGSNHLRGLYEGRIRDKHLMMLQAEYRAFLIWRLGATVHAGYGMVAPTFREYSLNNGLFSWGFGARVRPAKTTRFIMRFDYGRTKYGAKFYLTLGEAF